MQHSTTGRALNRLIHVVDKVHSTLLTALIAILAIGVIISVILRYFFGLSSAWSEELLTMSFVASTFFGASLCLREKEHISISIFSGSASSLKRKAYSIIVTLIVIAICAVVLRYSLLWISKVGKVPSPATGLPNGLFYFIMPISFSFTIFYAFVNIIAEYIPIDPPTTKSVFVGSSETGAGEESNR